MTDIALILRLTAAVAISALMLRRPGRNDVQVTPLRKEPFDVSSAYDFAPVSPTALEQSINRELLMDWAYETGHRMKGLLCWHLQKARREFHFSTAAELPLLDLYVRFVVVRAYLRLSLLFNRSWSRDSLARTAHLLIGFVDAIWTRYTVLLIEMARPKESAPSRSDLG
jgi:hypothetical protein